MKDVFDPESKKALIDYRIERAYETLKKLSIILMVASTMRQSTECIMHVSML